MLFNILIHEEVKEQTIKIPEKPKYQVLFFQGCMNKYINSSQKNALLKVMYDNNVEVEVGDFTCCGRLYYLLGKEKEYSKIVEKNKNIIDNSKYDYIIFDCATCYDTVLNYENIDTSKIIMAEDFLSKLDIKNKNNESVTYFKPCLLKNSPKILEQFNYIESKNDKNCCGMSIPFSIFNKKLSDDLSKDSADELLKTKANYILTSCSLCKIGIYKALINKKTDKQILSLMELLNR